MMSAYFNLGSRSQEDPAAEYSQPVAAVPWVDEEMEHGQVHEQVGKLYHLEPTDQRGDTVEDYLKPTHQRDDTVEDYLKPTHQRDDGYEKCNVYEDFESYTPIAQRRSQSQQHAEIPLSSIPPCPPRPREHSSTPHRADGSDLCGTGGYLEILPSTPEKTQSDRLVRTNKPIKWFMVGLAVLAVVSAAVGIGVRYNTWDTNECESSPCLNGGTCEDRVNGYRCHCLPGYNGTFCHNDTDECDSRPCYNGGTCENHDNGYTCHCKTGYIGTFCENDKNECESGPCFNEGTCEDRVTGYTCLCQPRYSGTFCQIENTGCDSRPCNQGWVCNARGNHHTCRCPPGVNCNITFLRRVDGSVNFYRDWANYTSGFGDPSGNFWLGLETLHQLTTQHEYGLRVDMEDWYGQTKWAEYKSFRVGSESDNYALTVTGYNPNSTTAGDSMARQNGAPFSTYNKDNDRDHDRNCASLYNSGWWFSACLQNNPTGRYRRPGYRGWFGVTWYHAYRDRRSFNSMTLQLTVN